MPSQRYLMVTADDFGIGPATSRGILDAAASGVITAAVLLVNSPDTENAVRAWRQRGCPMELGWHPNLTLDAPVLSAARVPSLTGPDGRFWPLRPFLLRWLLGRLREEEIELELAAQLRKFVELTGQVPPIVNTHQHVGVFPPVGRILLCVLEQHGCDPLVRRVRRSWGMLVNVPGARFKRVVLTFLGRRQARDQQVRQFAGNDWLAGIANPPNVNDPNFFKRWLGAAPGMHVELMCHPGHWDVSLVGRDCRPGDGWQERRVNELRLLKQPQFLQAVNAAGFTLAGPSQIMASGLHHGAAA